MDEELGDKIFDVIDTLKGQTKKPTKVKEKMEDRMERVKKEIGMSDEFRRALNTIASFSLEDLQKKKGQLEKMLDLLEEEHSQGIISDESYEDTKLRAIMKLEELNAEVATVSKIIARALPRLKG